ncbi:acyltransferase domain-containing protein [Desulfovibrio sp. 86]|uniref:Acyl transferase n=1 Tax=uncultured Desulfovibrio sp. TaxID=167968 RepID=A0A212L3F1_9BACT|nr:acyltransferase domain-containing protein [Desulfovibrio sp. 86]SCM72055.1 Acyl transferase [uncultured Desulfovibrio sp.]VZH33271.1 Acyl transferase [Desulfovibrio sp. 86]
MQQDSAPAPGTSPGKTTTPDSAVIEDGLLVASPPAITLSCPDAENPAESDTPSGQVCAQTLMRHCLDWLKLVENPGPVMLSLHWNESTVSSALAQSLSLALEGLQNLWRLGPVRLQFESFQPAHLRECERLLRTALGTDAAAKNTYPCMIGSAPQTDTMGVSMPQCPDYFVSDADCALGDEQPMRPQAGRVPTILLLDFLAGGPLTLQCQPLLLSLPAPTPPCCDTLICRKNPLQQKSDQPHSDDTPALWQPGALTSGAGLSSVASPAGTTESDGLPEELILDGVRYANLPQDGLMWRMGGTNPLWRQELLALPHNPDAADLARLEGRGVWLSPEVEAPPLAVMCCGLGSVWPGMGRELYDNFPVARAAMDRIAAVADWDVLGLMDEKDIEKVSLTRWQSPYLFMLEFAQWSILSSLGLRPTLFCGHSLGELIALCLSGFYDPEVAWYIIDTRAVHMSELESAATRETGMMAVHASAEIIDETRATWPALYVSNYNSPQQFILSGPREILMEARKSLRKRRIPAIMLNVSLAFHHPSMRMLRDLALRRLNALEMHAPLHPTMSCITTNFYPHDQPSICRHIADLDENSVRWTECVHTAWRRHGIRHFLEMGPQDTLCGLAKDNEPRAFCLTAGRKGKEVEGMRQTCARLYALGHLSKKAISARIADIRQGKDAVVAAHMPLPYCGLVPVNSPDGGPDCGPDCGTACPTAAPEATPIPAVVTAAAPAAAPTPDGAPVSAKPASSTDSVSSAAALRVVLDVLARASGRPVEDMRPDLDLRYDLALRSSRFPRIIQEVEKALDITVNFEDLLQVSTVGDLARILGASGLGEAKKSDTSEAVRQAEARQKALVRACAPLCRFTPLQRTTQSESGEKTQNSGQFPKALPLDPCGQGLPIRRGDILALLFFEPALLPSLMNGLAPLGCVLAVPRGQVEACAPLAKAGARIVPLNLETRVPRDASDAQTLAEEVATALTSLAKSEGRVDGLIFAPAGHYGSEEHDAAPLLSPASFAAVGMPKLLAAAMRVAQIHGLRYACLCSLLQPTLENLNCDSPLEKRFDELGEETGVGTRTIRLLEKSLRAGLNDWGDMMARELLRGTSRHVLWVRPATLPGFAASGAGLRPAPAAARGHAGRNDALTQGLVIQERPRLYPLVFPDPQPPYRATSTLFQGCCHYSRFADTDLALHGGQPGNVMGDTPWLPTSRTLEALLEASSLWLPWLTVIGFLDLRFYDPLLLPPGITRECRATVEAEPWLMQDGVMARMCRNTLDVRELTPNGRHLERYAPVAAGMTLLAAANGQVPPMWAHGEDAPAGSTQHKVNTDIFYDALGFGQPWRMLRDFTVLPNHKYVAGLEHCHPAIAPDANKGYADILHVVEGMVQSAWLAIARGNGNAEMDAGAVSAAMGRWRLHGAGFIRFGGERGKGPWRIMLRRSWSDPALLRFDGQAADEKGRIFLTIHHLEFNRRDTGAVAL